MVDILHYKTTAQTKAMRWSFANELVERERYRKVMSAAHSKFNLEETGLVVSFDTPYICCQSRCIGKMQLLWGGYCWVQYNMSHREKTIREFAATNGTCLEVNGEEIKLSRKYSYYYQTQMLLGVTKKLFDLFLVTSVEHYQERIKLNEELWKSCLPKSRAFLPNHLLAKSIKTY